MMRVPSSRIPKGWEQVLSGHSLLEGDYFWCAIEGNWKPISLRNVGLIISEKAGVLYIRQKGPPLAETSLQVIRRHLGGVFEDLLRAGYRGEHFGAAYDDVLLWEIASACVEWDKRSK
jgi:hypothetical protein